MEDSSVYTVATIPFRQKRQRLSLRYYLFDGDALWRIPNRLHGALLSGEAGLPQYVNSKQKVVEVFIWTSPRMARLIQARGTFVSFNSKGSIDWAASAEVVAIVIEGSKPRPLDKNVLDIGPAIRSRRLSRENIWNPSTGLLQAIVADVEGNRRIPTLRAAH